ncbi:MAG: metallophosphatase family protein [Treponema sp.]|jgi:predicted phosphodiesterase|nr:metallophosphatase family protein [Treponema sp.]
MVLLILSDIHANVSALTAVFDDAKNYRIDNLILLGDHIDYGMRPNETIELLKNPPFPIEVNIWGNHEKAIFDGDLDRFSSDRGREFSLFTSRTLNNETREYINKEMNIQGFTEKIYNGKQYLFIHGTLEDSFWKSIFPENAGEAYKKYDYVLSGHSHLPHYFEKYYKTDNNITRGRKKTAFINPGSVGQPRNHNPRACYAVLNTETGQIHLNNIGYDIKTEQALYGADVDSFYMNRLAEGV